MKNYSVGVKKIIKRRAFVTIVVCLISTFLLVGCEAAPDSNRKDGQKNVKAETQKAEDDIKGEEKPEKKKKKEKASKEDVKITDVSWNHGSYEEFIDADLDIAEVYFKLSNGKTITKQVPLGYYVDGKEELDIDGDGEDEIIIHQYFSNTAAEYDIVYVFKLTDGDVEDITPVDAVPELMENVANTEIKPLDKEGYPKYMLDVTTYKKDGADVSVKYHGSLAWHNGAWEELGHRVNYTVFDESKIDISPSKAVLKDVTVDDLSGDNTGDATLIVDKDTVFDKSCDMQYFPYYQNGDSPLEWFNHIKDIKDSEEYRAQGGALMGVFEVDMTGDHVDRFYGSY